MTPPRALSRSDGHRARPRACRRHESVKRTVREDGSGTPRSVGAAHEVEAALGDVIEQRTRSPIARESWTRSQTVGLVSLVSARMTRVGDRIEPNIGDVRTPCPYAPTRPPHRGLPPAAVARRASRAPLRRRRGPAETTQHVLEGLPPPPSLGCRAADPATRSSLHRRGCPQNGRRAGTGARAPGAAAFRAPAKSARTLHRSKSREETSWRSDGVEDGRDVVHSRLECHVPRTVGPVHGDRERRDVPRWKDVEKRSLKGTSTA